MFAEVFFANSGNYAIYPTIGLVLFMTIMIGVTVWTFRSRNLERYRLAVEKALDLGKKENEK